VVSRFDRHFAALPLVAILRGIRPDEAEAIGETLVETGFRLIEVPLNSPDSLDSIGRLVRHLKDKAMVGAGTVLAPAEVEAVAKAGGELIVSPNMDERVIAATKAAGLVSVPGYATPTEAFAALRAGADVLKLFPAEAASAALLRAHFAVLPADIRVLPVGGITVEAMAGWRNAGAAGFGLGSALYLPGMAAVEVRLRAETFVAAWRG
jgi:2-dehydro-3-deoxyphosphogalactonate aldolase